MRMLIMHYTHNYFHRRVTFHIVPRINDIQHEAHIFESITGLRHDRHNNFTIIENKMMDNCTLVNKLLRWHEPLAGPARGNSGCLEFVCKKLLLYVSGISEQIEAKNSADIFHRKYWVWCYPNLCNIRRCYPNILSVCPIQRIPTVLNSGQETSRVSVWHQWPGAGGGTGATGGTMEMWDVGEIIYICEVISG